MDTDKEKIKQLKAEIKRLKSVLQVASIELTRADPLESDWMGKLLAKINKVLDL